MQLSDEFENKQTSFQQLATLKAELEKEMYVLILIYGQHAISYERLL